MTNFNEATRSFDLCTEGTSSYAWAWEGVEHADCVGDMKLVGKTPEQFARDWSNTLLKACVDQITEGERGFSVEEITNDLIDDRHNLAAALQAWLEGDEPEEDDKPEDPQDDPTEGGSEPLYEITHEIMGKWDAPVTATEIEQAVAQWHTRGAEYSVKVDLDVVYVYVKLDEVNHGTDEDGDMWATDSDFRPSSDNWVQLDIASYRLEIGELYQPEDDQEPFTVATSWWFNGAGGLDTLTVKAWASEAQFKEQNPNVKLVPSRDGIRNHTKWMIDSVYDHPEGGTLI